MAHIQVMTTTITESNDMELGQLVPAPSAFSLATPNQSVFVTNTLSTSPVNPDESKRQRSPGLPMRIIEVIPPEALNSVAQAAKLVSVMVKPVPWLGEAAELVASIIVLCQNVGKNREAAVGLAEHCRSMLDAINQTFPETEEPIMEGLRKELISLLVRINVEVDEWAKTTFLKAFVKQEKISEAIKSFHVEIDQFCKRYMIVTQTLTFNWMKDHEKRTREDFAESQAFLVASENRQTLAKASIEELREDVREVLHLLQQFLLQSNWNEEQRRAMKENFQAMCDSSGQLPPGVELHEDFLTQERDPVKGNGTFDIYRGSCLGCQYPCAIKVVRRMAYNENTKRRFERQFKLWKAVHAKDEGRHILPLIGAVYRIQAPYPYLCFVSPWMEKGNALHYVKENDYVDRIKLIRSIAEGLQVLHTFEPPLLHGFLKSSNILIDDFGSPLLADFGLLRIIEQEKFQVTSYPEAVNAYRWLAPEMATEEKEPTAKSDVFMYAMTVLELMTQEVPFSHIKRDPQVLSYRHSGGLPIRPTDEKGVIVRNRGLDDRLWELLLKCWEREPEARPSITDVLEELQTYPSSQI